MNFKDLKINSKYFSLLSQFFKSKSVKKIKTIIFTYNHLRDHSLSIFIDSFPDSLIDLNINQNELERQGAIFIAKLFHKHKNLKSLNICNQFIGSLRNNYHSKCCIRGQNNKKFEFILELDQSFRIQMKKLLVICLMNQLIQVDINKEYHTMPNQTKSQVRQFLKFQFIFIINFTQYKFNSTKYNQLQKQQQQLQNLRTIIKFKNSQKTNRIVLKFQIYNKFIKEIIENFKRNFQILQKKEKKINLIGQRKMKMLNQLNRFQTCSHQRYFLSLSNIINFKSDYITRKSQEKTNIIQVSREPAGSNLESQKSQVMQTEEKKKTRTELKKSKRGKKRIHVLKMLQDIEAFLQPQKT